nr:4-(cytidine 5'-diphospho)-2-C-methyl-D-erythritol kinase [Rhodothermaceae bacterium]
GGSSDAAHTLLLINEFLDLGASQDDLHNIASQLGSDVPFFLGGSAALGTGRGEILTPLLHNDGSEYLLPYHLLLAVPPVHVSTQEAYQYVKPNEIERPVLTDLVLKCTPEDWRARLVNDFEASVFKTHPTIENVKNHLYNFGALYAAMSGSGSSVFGLFEDERKCLEAAKMLQSEGIKVWTEAPHSETL